MKKFIFAVSLAFILTRLPGQVLEIEKTFDVTGKADIGDIANVAYDQQSGQSVYSFIVKAKSDQITIESYAFDKEFNMVKNESATLSFDQAKTKYPWWNYKGEHLETSDLVVDEDDDIILRKKSYEMDYDWKKLDYKVKAEVKEKIKMKNEAGEKFLHHRNWTPESGDFLFILGGEQSKSDKFLQNRTFELMKISDKDAAIIKQLNITFDFPQSIVYPRFNDEKSEGRGSEVGGDLVLVFAPMNAGKLSDPSKSNYTYIRIDQDLNLVARVAFTSPTAFWSVEDHIYDAKTKAVYLLGASLTSENKYFSDLTDTKKFNGFQLMKVVGDKVEYLNSVTLDDLNSKVVMPPSQKKATKYEGKKFIIAEYTLTSDGKLFLVGQSWYVDALGTMDNMNSGMIGKKTRKIKYSDCFGLGFDERGKLIGQYLYDTKGFMGGNDFSVYQYLFPGNNPSNIYWFILQPNYWNWNPTVQIYDYKPVKQPELKDFIADVDWNTMSGDFNPFVFVKHKVKCDIISSNLAKIDLSKNQIGDFVNYQVDKAEKKSYYLCPGKPLMLTNDNKLLLFGSQSMKKGKTLWFARFLLE